MRFQGAQRIDLAGNADHRDALMASRRSRFQKGEQRRIAHAHAAAGGHAFCLRHQHRHGLPFVIRVRRHGQHGGHRARFQQLFSQARGDAGPLRAGLRRLQRCAQHLPEGAEMQFIRARRFSRAAMHRRFQARVIRLDELAGSAACLGVFQARNTAIRA